MDGRGLHPRQPNRRPLLREYRRRFYRRAGMTGTNMTRYPIVAAALFFIFPTAPALASGPSFDCAKATRQLDRAICAWGTVASLAGEMAAVFADWPPIGRASCRDRVCQYGKIAV